MKWGGRGLLGMIWGDCRLLQLDEAFLLDNFTLSEAFLLSLLLQGRYPNSVISQSVLPSHPQVSAEEFLSVRNPETQIIPLPSRPRASLDSP